MASIVPIVLLTRADSALHHRVMRALECDVVTVNDVDELRAHADRILLSYAHSMIVPDAMLRAFKAGAYNLHAGSPAFPGRDPHHWAVYHGTREYGATLHQMTGRVDEGPIVDVELFPVDAASTPMDLLAAADSAAVTLCQRFGACVRDGKLPQPLANVQWSGIKRRRADLHAICDLPFDISSEEFERRKRAFESHHRNLTVTLHNTLFRIDTVMSPCHRGK